MKNDNKDKLSLEALDLAVMSADGSLDPQYFRSYSRLNIFYNINDYVIISTAFQSRLEDLKTEEKKRRSPEQIITKNKKPVKANNFSKAELALFIDKDLRHPAFEPMRKLEQLVNEYVANITKLTQPKRYKRYKGKPIYNLAAIMKNHVEVTAKIVREIIIAKQALLGIDIKNSQCQNLTEKYNKLKAIVSQKITHFEEKFGDVVSHEMESKLEQALKYFKLAFIGQNRDFNVKCYQKCLQLFDEFGEQYPWFGDIYYYRAKAYYEIGEYYIAKSLVELVHDYWQFKKTQIGVSIINTLIEDINAREEEMCSKNSANRPC